MKRAIALLGAALFTSILGVTVVAQPAQAACGQQWYLREPAYGPWLNWASGSTWTRIEPHGSIQLRAAIGRYTGSGVVYYYGSWAQNGDVSTSSNVQSRVTGSEGTNSGNYYSANGSTDAVDRKVNSLYNDNGYCKFSTY